MSAQILSYTQPSKRGHEKKTSQLLEFQIKVKLNRPCFCSTDFSVHYCLELAAPGESNTGITGKQN